MSAARSPQVTLPKEDAEGTLRLGGWLFRQRSWLPVPLALLVLALPPDRSAASSVLTLVGFGFVTIGELVRLWSVRHIGVISRTRSTRLGPLVVTGPFSWVRNPLYLGNLALWSGFALAAHLVWAAALVFGALAGEYQAIVRWEEHLLEARLGGAYRAYAASVPRWLPRWPTSGSPANSECLYGWRDTLFSERGTLIAIALGALLLSLKASLYR